VSWKPKYSGPGQTGICICGHAYHCHHLGVVLNQDYRDQTGEAYLPEECEFYGFNEDGGLDEEGNDHCKCYKDAGTVNSD
jgi:hypothetical protein